MTPPGMNERLTCRRSAPERPIPCIGGCDYLCARLRREFPGFTEAQIAAGLTTPAVADDGNVR